MGIIISIEKNTCTGNYSINSGGSCFSTLFLLLVCGSTITAQPKPGSVVFNGEFGAAIVWDGFALQEKQLSKLFGFGIIIDSAGRYIDSGGLEYFHPEFGPAADIAVYVFPWMAVGAGYSYGWVEQFMKTHRRIKDNPGGRRLCSSHRIRGQLIYSVCLKNLDVIDIIGVPFFIFGSLTRLPLSLTLYKDIADAESFALLQEIHEPVSFTGYGVEIRIRGRHFLNKYVYFHGSFYCRVEKMRTEKDPFGEFLSNTPQGSCGLTLGAGFMLGGNKLMKERSDNEE
ncbi:MAG: hypothetical protein JW913_04735 [Chitinispirillaceae bacterium]|nr:hypothetical protein [Chitinispirillaceae bacterium]